MPYAVTLKLDEAGAAEVRRLWRVLDDSGVARSVAMLDYPPHITLSRHDVLDPLATADLLEGFAAGLPPVNVMIERLATFTRPSNVLWAGPAEHTELGAFHSRLRRLLAAHAWDPQTEVQQWVPHITLTTSVADAAALERASKLVAPAFRAFAARLVELELVRFPPVTVVASFELGGLHATGSLH